MTIFTQAATNTLNKLSETLGAMQSDNHAVGEQLSFEVQTNKDGAIVTFPDLTAGDVTNYAVKISSDGQMTLGRKKWGSDFIPMDVTSLDTVSERLLQIANSYNDTFVAKKTAVSKPARPRSEVFASGKAYKRNNG